MRPGPSVTAGAVAVPQTGHGHQAVRRQTRQFAAKQ